MRDHQAPASEQTEVPTAAVRSAAEGLSSLQRLGYPLSKPLPKGAEAPAYGEKPGQRRHSVKQFDAMWAAQFHAMSLDEQLNVYQGCIEKAVRQ